MEDRDYMLMALLLAKRRQGACAPNPAVGAVLVRDNRVLATGFHWGVGHEHAEVHALNQVEHATGATLYVTLEPCCIWQHTPPCTEAILRAGVSRVVYGLLDPNPEIAGDGVRQLQQAGVDCEHYELAEIDYFYRAYCHWRSTGLPMFTMKFAVTMLGEFAALDKRPLAITSERLAVMTHQQRSQHDAILTTVATVAADDPKLNVRLLHDTYAKPVIILDSQARLSTDAAVFEHASQVIVLHATSAAGERIEALQQRGAQCYELDHDGERLDWRAIADCLGRQGMQSIWVEAGAMCCQHLLASGLLSQAIFYFAPGDQAGQQAPWIQQALLQAKQLNWQHIDRELVADCYYDTL